MYHTYFTKVSNGLSNHKKLGYHLTFSIVVVCFLLVLLFQLSLGNAHFPDFGQYLVYVVLIILKYYPINVCLCTSSILLFLSTMYYMSRTRDIYLLNFACYKGSPSEKVSLEIFMDRTQKLGVFSKENVEFQKKILERSGLGQETYFPEALIRVPPNPCMTEARNEAREVMFGTIDELLAKTMVQPKDIGILIVNSSLFNPTPSLSSMIVNHYKLRSNVMSFNLGGMGCSASPIAIDLAKDLLQVHGNTYALIVSLENITQNWYWGNNRSMMLPNCLFRLGGAAILLSNRREDRCRSKYQLMHTVRTHKGSEDKSYNCVYQKEDENMKVGISLSKDLMKVAGEALKENIIQGAKVHLPVAEQLLFLATLAARKMLKMKIKPYMPDFKRAFQHFCIHAGGRAVLDEMEKKLELTQLHTEPSRMTLYRFGNTSSSSIWYELAYVEAKGKMRKGDHTWQIAFGSGFKCNSAVWRALKTIDPVEEKNPWSEEIDKFPVDVPKVTPLS